MVTFKINGRAVTVSAGAYILNPIRELGLDIPTLCDHPSLEPYGACCLCIVEVTHPRWEGRTRLVTSCNYPAQEGLQVFTTTPRVLHCRRQLFDMLLPRCPGNQALRDLARKYAGITESSLASADEPSDCILCGLCVRICEERSTCVLGFRDRGRYREVSPPEPPEECVGCAACALVCPTDAIPFTREKGVWRVWDRDFTIPFCRIDPELCRGCGLCEEACYFDVAQVKLYATGTAASFIDRDLCQGCGSCIAICPTGAIHQEVYAETELLKRVRELAKEEPRVVIFNCPRSPLPDELRAKTIGLPCIGRVSLPMLLAALLAGARKVLLMGRDPASCFFGTGEAHAREKVGIANSLAALMGFGEARCEVRLPEAGYAAPADLVREELAASHSPNPLEGEVLPVIEEGGLDAVARELVALCEKGITPDLSQWKEEFLPAAGAETVQYVHRISIFDQLCAAVTGHHHLRDAVAQALVSLGGLGIAADIISGRAGCHGSETALTDDAVRIGESGAKRVLCVCPGVVPHLASRLPGIDVVWLDRYLAQLAAEVEPVSSLRVAVADATDLPAIPGVEWVEYASEIPGGKFSFTLSPETVRAWHRRLIDAEAIPGVTHVLCACPGDYLQMMLLRREGAWRLSRAEPVTLGELACRVIRGAQDG